MQVSAQHYSGPIPAPEILAKFESILPGATERIFKHYEDQVKHRIETETSIVQGQLKLEKTGQWMAFILAILVLLVSVLLILKGLPVGGLVGILSTLAALVGVFIYNKKTEEKA